MRLTPLNIFTSIVLVFLGYMILAPSEQNWSLLTKAFLVLLAVICFIGDLIFRTFVKDVKRIWIMELLIIIFAAILLILFKRG